MESPELHGQFDRVIIKELLDLCFKCLYELPLSKTTFCVALVNKTWNEMFTHPLQLFWRGEFKLLMLRCPPSFYYNHKQSNCRRIWHRIKRSIGMTRQIMSVQEGDEQHEAFIMQEIIYHEWYSRVKSASFIVSLMLESLGTRFMGHQWTASEYYKSMDDVMILKKVKLSDNDTVPVQVLNLISRDQRLCELAVKECGFRLRFVPPKWRTAELCEIAVRNNCMDLTEVPDELKTLEMCKIKLWYHPTIARADVPTRFRKAPEIIDIMKSLLSKLETEQGCLELLQTENNYQTRNLISVIPSHLKTEKVCKAMVEQGITYHQTSLSAIDLIPTKFQSREICEMALKQMGEGLLHIPDHFARSEDFCRLSVREDGNMINFVCRKTKELCLIAVESNINALSFVPPDLQQTVRSELFLEKPQDIA